MDIMKNIIEPEEKILKEVMHAAEVSRTGWDLFSPEVAWFIFDFFRYDLNGYEKLIFYCYYVNGMTLMEIGDAADCSFQNIGAIIKKIEKKLHKRWVTKEEWRVPDDSECRAESDSRGNKKGSKRRRRLINR